MTICDVTIPIRVRNRLNQHVSGWTKGRERKGQREAVTLFLRTNIRDRSELKLPLRVTMTKISPTGRPLDSDGLQSALKSVRDSVAAVVGIDDGKDGWDWQYRQDRGEHGVRVVIEGKAAV